MDIVHEIDIATTPQRLFEALTTQAGLSAWYTPDTKVMGNEVQFKFSALTTLRFCIEKLERNRLVTWKGIDVPEEWKSTPITFDIVPDGDSVTLKFRQSGFADGYRAFGGFSYCWGQYIRSIKLLLETGHGEPFGSAASIASGTTPRSSH